MRSELQRELRVSVKCNDDSGGDTEVGMILSRRTDRGALAIFKLVINKCPEAEVGVNKTSV